MAVRNSTAQHLHQLADKLGAAVILKAGSFTERFLIAASRMAGDAAPEARWVLLKGFGSALMWKSCFIFCEFTQLMKINENCNLPQVPWANNHQETGPSQGLYEFVDEDCP